MNTADPYLGLPDGISAETIDRLGADLSDVLTGLPYLFARSSHGNELTLHFGVERSHASPRLAGKIRGTHVLSVRGSAWTLKSGIKRVMIACGVVPASIASEQGKPFNVTALESGAMIGQGATIESVGLYIVEPPKKIGLGLGLSDGSEFMVIPTSADADSEDKLPEPSDWELLTPSRVIRVGPGPSYAVEDFGQPPR